MKKIFTMILNFSVLISWVFFAAGCIFKLPKEVSKQKNVEFARVGDRSLKLDIYSPKHPAEKTPVIVWIHGGGWNKGSKRFCPLGMIATQRVAVVSIEYRLSGDAKFPAQIFDCKGAIRWLRTNAEKYNFDPDRIGIFGVSAGGHLAALLGTTDGVSKLEGDVGGNLNFSSRVQCVTAFYPPTDLNIMVSNPDDRKNPKALAAILVGGIVDDNVDKIIAASPTTYVTKDAAPFFLFHGEKDTLVPVEQSRLLYDALKKAGVEVQLETAPNKGHGAIPSKPVVKEIFEFFDRHLGTRTVETLKN